MTFRDPRDYDEVGAGDDLEIPTDDANFAVGKPITVKNKTKGTTFDVDHNLDARQITIVRAGGLLNYTKR